MAVTWPAEGGRDAENRITTANSGDMGVSRAVYGDVSDQAEVGPAEAFPMHSLAELLEKCGRSGPTPYTEPTVQMTPVLYPLDDQEEINLTSRPIDLSEGRSLDIGNYGDNLARQPVQEPLQLSGAVLHVNLESMHFIAHLHTSIPSPLSAAILRETRGEHPEGP